MSDAFGIGPTGEEYYLGFLAGGRDAAPGFPVRQRKIVAWSIQASEGEFCEGFRSGLGGLLQEDPGGHGRSAGWVFGADGGGVLPGISGGQRRSGSPDFLAEMGTCGLG